MPYAPIASLCKIRPPVHAKTLPYTNGKEIYPTPKIYLTPMALGHAP